MEIQTFFAKTKYLFLHVWEKGRVREVSILTEFTGFCRWYQCCNNNVSPLKIVIEINQTSATFNVSNLMSKRQKKI